MTDRIPAPETTDRDRVFRELELALDQMDLEEDVDWLEDLPDGFEDLYLYRSMVLRVARAANLLRERIETAVAHELGDGGVARVGDDFLRYSRKPDYVLTDGGRLWLGTLDPADILAVVPKPSKFRKTGLEAVAKKRGLDPRTLEGSLYVDRGSTKDPKLGVQPVGHANTPQYASTMKSGEIRRRLDTEIERRLEE
jgi:hypothetical protein